MHLRCTAGDENGRYALVAGNRLTAIFMELCLPQISSRRPSSRGSRLEARRFGRTSSPRKNPGRSRRDPAITRPEGLGVLAFARMLPVGTLVLALLTGAVPAGDDAAVREVTILYTNDFHSAFDPIPGYWLPGSPRLGGAAHLATLMDKIRAREKPVFLFDTGDMFTGMLSNLTRGEALMEMMRAHALRRHGHREPRVRLRRRQFPPPDERHPLPRARGQHLLQGHGPPVLAAVRDPREGRGPAGRHRHHRRGRAERRPPLRHHEPRLPRSRADRARPRGRAAGPRGRGGGARPPGQDGTDADRRRGAPRGAARLRRGCSALRRGRGHRRLRGRPRAPRHRAPVRPSRDRHRRRPDLRLRNAARVPEAQAPGPARRRTRRRAPEGLDGGERRRIRRSPRRIEAYRKQFEAQIGQVLGRSRTRLVARLPGGVEPRRLRGRRDARGDRGGGRPCTTRAGCARTSRRAR